MGPPVTISAKALRACVLAAGKRGVAPEALLGPIGADMALLDDADAHVPIEWVLRAWNEAPALTGDPAFGLHAAELMSATRAHVLDYVAAHCQRPRGAAPTLVSALRRHLISLAPASPASIEQAARVLGMSERSLQRQLRTEGTSFKSVIDGVRHDLSLSYLREGRCAISEVAFLVGFAEVSAFSRAFRRWTGESPVAWRRGNTGGAGGTISGARGQGVEGTGA